MSIASQLDAALKEGMRQRDSERVACIRQLRSKVQEAVNSPDFTGSDQDDALYQVVIASYIKQLNNGIEQMAQAGERGAALSDKYRREVAYLEPFLPKMLDAATTRKHVQAALEELKIADPKQAGRVLGHLMKQYRGQIDPSLARQLILEHMQPPS